MLTGKSGKVCVRLIMLFVACIFFSGCATIFAPGSDKITIKTNPEGADVYDGANFLGKTPLTHTFKRDTFEEKTLTIKKSGYQNQTLPLSKTVEKTALFNFIFFLITCGAPSWGIDALSGNMTKYSPDSYFIELESNKNPAGQTDNTLHQRLRFVLLNHYYLMKDIASGGGEYLRAYYEISPSNQIFIDYEGFLKEVSKQAKLLLQLDDPVEFNTVLERNFSSI